MYSPKRKSHILSAVVFGRPQRCRNYHRQAFCRSSRGVAESQQTWPREKCQVYLSKEHQNLVNTENSQQKLPPEPLVDPISFVDFGRARCRRSLRRTSPFRQARCFYPASAHLFSSNTLSAQQQSTNYLQALFKEAKRSRLRHDCQTPLQQVESVRRFTYMHHALFRCLINYYEIDLFVNWSDLRR